MDAALMTNGSRKSAVRADGAGTEFAAATRSTVPPSSLCKDSCLVNGTGQLKRDQDAQHGDLSRVAASLCNDRNHAREDVRLNQGDQADERRTHDREPEHAPENRAKRARAFGRIFVAGGG